MCPVEANLPLIRPGHLCMKPILLLIKKCSACFKESTCLWRKETAGLYPRSPICCMSHQCHRCQSKAAVTAAALSCITCRPCSFPCYMSVTSYDRVCQAMFAHNEAGLFGPAAAFRQPDGSQDSACLTVGQHQQTCNQAPCLEYTQL